MDAYGNLTTLADFADGVIVRFVSRMDPNVILGCSGLQLDEHDNPMGYMTVFVQHLPVNPEGDCTRFVIRPTGDGVTFKLDLYDGPWGWQLTSLVDGDYGPLQVLPQQEGSSFRVDFVQDCWFALNTPDGALVMDIRESDTTPYNPIFMWPWNGGDNQIWRAQKVG